jgi:hypothetical protein
MKSEETKQAVFGVGYYSKPVKHYHWGEPGFGFLAPLRL